jgi:hypothetical protein
MWVTFLLLGLLVGVAAGGGGAFLLTPASSEPDAAASPSATATPTPTPTPFAGDVSSLLVPAYDPATSIRTAGQSAQQLADQFTNSDLALHILRANAYESAAYRRWSMGDSDMFVEIAQFDTAGGARTFALFQDDEFLGATSYTDSSPAAGIDGSGLYTRKTVSPVSKKWIVYAVAARGSIAIFLYVRNLNPVDASVAGRLLKQQYDLLPAV